MTIKAFKYVDALGEYQFYDEDGFGVSYSELGTVDQTVVDKLVPRGTPKTDKTYVVDPSNYEDLEGGGPMVNQASNPDSDRSEQSDDPDDGDSSDGESVQSDGGQSDASDGESGDQDAEGDPEGDPQGDGDDQDEGDGEDEGEGDMEFDDSEDPQSEDIENPLLKDLYDDGLHELIAEIAENRSNQAYRSAISYARARIRMGGNPAADISVEKPEPIKLDNLPQVRHFAFEDVLQCVVAGDTYIPGPPGTGKSHVAEQIAETLGRGFTMLACSPLDTPAKWFGFVDANGNARLEVLYDAFVNGHILLIDEMDNSNPSMVTGVNSLIANRKYSFPGVGLVEAHPDFRLIATANTYGTGPTAEFAGRCRLDPATLDRFAIVPMDVDEGIETLLVEAIIDTKEADRWLARVRNARRACSELNIRHFVTMRGAIEGAKLIAAGATLKVAYERRIVGTLSDDMRAKIAAFK